MSFMSAKADLRKEDRRYYITLVLGIIGAVGAIPTVPFIIDLFKKTENTSVSVVKVNPVFKNNPVVLTKKYADKDTSAIAKTIVLNNNTHESDRHSLHKNTSNAITKKNPVGRALVTKKKSNYTKYADNSQKRGDSKLTRKKSQIEHALSKNASAVNKHIHKEKITPVLSGNDNLTKNSATKNDTVSNFVARNTAENPIMQIGMEGEKNTGVVSNTIVNYNTLPNTRRRIIYQHKVVVIHHRMRPE